MYSFYDVVNGKVPDNTFRDCVVLVGDYTQKDATLKVPNQSDQQMQEVEVQANMLQALLDDDVARERVMQKYLSTGRDLSEDTLHGVFFDICVNSGDPKIFAASDYRVRQSMEVARKMGLKAVVFHTNYIVNFRLQSYLDTWLEKNEAYWRKILREFPNQMIYMENMFDDAPAMLLALAERMADEPRFAVCLDIAHAMISGSPLSPWLSGLKPYVRHVHINDNDGREDLHRAIGSGVFDWTQYQDWMMSFSEKPSVLIEVRGFNDLQQSVQYMQKEKLYPFSL